MADKAKIVAHWQADELDAIVADYFDMLAADLSGRHTSSPGIAQP